MIKEYLKLTNIIPIVWALMLLFITVKHNEYYETFLYLSLPILTIFTIFNLIKQRREDQLNGTTLFKASIYRMLIMAGVLLVFFLITMVPSI